MIPKFATENATSVCELRNRDTRVMALSRWGAMTTARLRRVFPRVLRVSAGYPTLARHTLDVLRRCCWNSASSPSVAQNSWHQNRPSLVRYGSRSNGLPQKQHCVRGSLWGCNMNSLASRFRWQHDAIEVFRFAAEVERSTDVVSQVRGALLHDLARGDRNPGAIDLDFVMVADRPARGRTAVREIAARYLSVGCHQVLVEVLMPLVMVVADIAFLRRCSCRENEEEDDCEQIPHANLPQRTGLSALKDGIVRTES